MRPLFISRWRQSAPEATLSWRSLTDWRFWMKSSNLAKRRIPRLPFPILQFDKMSYVNEQKVKSAYFDFTAWRFLRFCVLLSILFHLQSSINYCSFLLDPHLRRKPSWLSSLLSNKHLFSPRPFKFLRRWLPKRSRLIISQYRACSSFFSRFAPEPSNIPYVQSEPKF